MGKESRLFSQLKKVTIVHVVLLLLLLFWGVLGNFFKKDDKVVMPIEFMVAVPSSAMSLPDDTIPNPIKKPSPIKKPDPVKPKPKTKPKPKPKPKRKIKVNNQRVVRNNPSQSPPKDLLSPEEIERRLKMGAKPGHKNTSIPDEDSRGYLLIKQTLYDLWLPPDKEVVGENVAKVILKISSNGTIIYKRLLESGIQQMDTSVSGVLNAVVRIPGLPAGFLERHSNESMTITFKVQ